MKRINVVTVSLCWGEGDEEPVGRLAARDGKIYVELDEAFLASGRVLSWILRTPSKGVRQGPDAPFSGLHGVFNDSLPDGWGRLIHRRAAAGKVNPLSLPPLDMLACMGEWAMGALVYRPEDGARGHRRHRSRPDRRFAGDGGRVHHSSGRRRRYRRAGARCRGPMAGIRRGYWRWTDIKRSDRKCNCAAANRPEDLIGGLHSPSATRIGPSCPTACPRLETTNHDRTASPPRVWSSRACSHPARRLAAGRPHGCGQRGRNEDRPLYVILTAATAEFRPAWRRGRGRRGRPLPTRGRPSATRRPAASRRAGSCHGRPPGSPRRPAPGHRRG